MRVTSDKPPGCISMCLTYFLFVRWKTQILHTGSTNLSLILWIMRWVWLRLDPIRLIPLLIQFSNIAVDWTSITIYAFSCYLNVLGTSMASTTHMITLEVCLTGSLSLWWKPFFPIQSSPRGSLKSTNVSGFQTSFAFGKAWLVQEQPNLITDTWKWHIDLWMID